MAVDTAETAKPASLCTPTRRKPTRRKPDSLPEVRGRSIRQFGVTAWGERSSSALPHWTALTKVATVSPLTSVPSSSSPSPCWQPPAASCSVGARRLKYGSPGCGSGPSPPVWASGEADWSRVRLRGETVRCRSPRPPMAASGRAATCRIRVLCSPSEPRLGVSHARMPLDGIIVAGSLSS